MTYGVILADGSAVDIIGSSSGFAWIMIDIDGFNKGANKRCYDYFSLRYDSSKGVYYTTSRAEDGYGIDMNNGSDGSLYCTAWVLQYGNMDYLKCSGLKFGTNTTCK